jgi:hypothetical protein
MEWWREGVREWWSTGVTEGWSGGVRKWWSKEVVEGWSGGLSQRMANSVTLRSTSSADFFHLLGIVRGTNK